MPSRPFAKGHDPVKLARALKTPNRPGIWEDLGLTGTLKLVSPRAQLKRPPAELLCPPCPEDDSEETARELASVARAVLSADQPIDLRTVSALLTKTVLPGNAQSLHPFYRVREGFYGTTPQTRDAILRGNVPEPQRFGLSSLIMTPRVLASAFHQDEPYFYGLTAATLLSQLRVPRSSLFPPLPCESGFVSYGGTLQLQCLLPTAAELAMRAAWYEKFRVSRRRRPEELAADPASLYPTWREIGAPLLRTYGGCLPMLIAEGCPGHASYPSGHAVIGGAVCTVLLAHFEDMPMQASDGSPSTTHAEIRKLGWDFGDAREILGIHYRSDIREGLLLGQRAALLVLREARQRSAEPWGTATFTGFDGKAVTV